MKEADIDFGFEKQTEPCMASLGLMVLLVAAVVPLGGCKTVKCGSGTVEKNGVCVVDDGKKKAAAPEVAAPTLTVTAPALKAEFESNAVAARKKYLGKTVRVTGAIDEIRADGSLYLHGTERLKGVAATFVDSESDKIADLHKGDEVDAVCTVKDADDYDVTVGNCRLDVSPSAK